VTEERRRIDPSAAGLCALLDSCTDMSPTGFSVRVALRTDEWDACLRTLGIRRACALMAVRLCERYHAVYGREFLFSERCVAYELKYHLDAYLWARGYRGYYRNITTWLFSRKKLILHCKETDISTRDIDNKKQRIMFGYKKGVREACKNTPRDPFDRRSLFRRVLSRLRG